MADGVVRNLQPRLIHFHHFRAGCSTARRGKLAAYTFANSTAPRGGYIATSQWSGFMEQAPPVGSCAVTRPARIIAAPCPPSAAPPYPLTRPAIRVHQREHGGSQGAALLCGLALQQLQHGAPRLGIQAVVVCEQNELGRLLGGQTARCNDRGLPHRCCGPGRIQGHGMSGSSIDSRRRVEPTAPAPPLAPAPRLRLSPPAQLVAAPASTNRAPSSSRIAGAAVCKRGGGRAAG